jgi:hypothetical protein
MRKGPNYSRDRRAEHPQAHLAGYAGILQADAYDGYNRLYLPDRKPGPIREAACWAHARRKFFELADIEENARRRAAAKKEIPISPIAIGVVRRIDALFEIERGKTPQERMSARRLESRPLVDDLHTYLGEQVAKRGSRMRVNVQLIAAESGNHLWAERFDKPLADLFDMQDEIVARLANALNAQLVAAEARRAEQTPNPDSIDLYFQGMAWFNKGIRPDTLARARGFFERALALDPGNLDAEMGTAQVDTLLGNSYLIDDPRRYYVAAEPT